MADASGNITTTNRIVIVGVPLAETLPPSNALNHTATLNGLVDAQGTETTAWFEWGNLRGCANSTAPITAGSGVGAVLTTVTLNDLTPGVIHFYRVVASNSLGIARGRHQLLWTPAVSLNGATPITNECHAPFTDPGATANASPLQLAAGWQHSLALRPDGTIAAWGDKSRGQTNTPAGATNAVAIATGAYHGLVLRNDRT